MSENKIPERKQWHVDKTISVGHLLSTIVIAVSVFSWASAVDKRVEQNAEAVKYLKIEQNASNEKIKTARKELRSDLRDISNKLDRLIERKQR